MASESLFLRSVIPTIPPGIAKQIRSLCTSPANENTLENLVRFLVGAEHAPDAPKDIREKWSEKQLATKNIISALMPPTPDKKRGREEEELPANDQQSKKPRLEATTKSQNAEDAPLVDVGSPIFTLHSVSTASPIRKKVDITIHQNSIVLTNPTSRATETTIPLSCLHRAFLLPTRGKSKPHWTVVILSSDIPDNPKVKSTAPSENHQIIFGLDATTAAATTITKHDLTTGQASPVSIPKGSSVLEHIETFLQHLKEQGHVQIIRSDAGVFKSSCPGIGANASGTSGIPGVEAYRAAKPGNLWFSNEGILWGESKPCEFWAVEDLYGKKDGVRIVGGGRTCTVVLTRKLSSEGDEEEVEETEFGMVDAKERENINEWVKHHRHLFGKTEEGEKELEDPQPKPQHSGPVTIHNLLDGSDDEEDDDFSVSVSDLDGSERSSEGEGDSSDEEVDEGGEESDAEGEDGPLQEEENDQESDIEELDPAHHPLLRPGAVPKMSKAAMEMAVGIVEGAFGGGEEPDELDDEEDQLED
ncbi:hypothetical protein D9613_003653 [Agrocybe pediades]|uniref:Histone chaperone RTT106/FACT complex subunit SPT16-like middle domain-containing protein n=1 Tax=Agrocybe pediades TaxID=84607 RepID=A0A8H4QI95_9AGAR|nr:hypothetical protein D9613_003653 [Agrocybe pediades]